jgi:putative endonuclease
MIKNTANRLYVGITEDPEVRLQTHNLRQGAKFTKYKPNYRIVFLEPYQTLAEARKREVQIKKWNRKKKEILIARYSNNLPTKM